MPKLNFALLLALAHLGLFFQPLVGSQTSQIIVQPGDSWEALSLWAQVDLPTLHQLNPHPNPQRWPAIGSEFTFPETAVAQNGRLERPPGNLLRAAVANQTAPWTVAIRNNRPSPYRTNLYQTIFIPGGQSPPRDLPMGFGLLEVSQPVGSPGQALAFRAAAQSDLSVTAVFDQTEMAIITNGQAVVGLTGTGAFFGTQQPQFSIQVAGAPLWSQPWQIRDQNSWIFQQITLTGTAAQIDQQSIADERARLVQIWENNSGLPQWTAPFQVPIASFLEISSPFGARRSYNGGPYRSYHEGVDFSAFGGTAVLAPASGTVVLAEFLYVRGGAVILDHGLGVYSGFYHLSSLDVAPGEIVQAGQVIGGVGTTGLSTGNHLHWDLLVNGVWVDAQAWRDQGLDCWIVAGLNLLCG